MALALSVTKALSTFCRLRIVLDGKNAKRHKAVTQVAAFLHVCIQQMKDKLKLFHVKIDFVKTHIQRI